MSNEILCAACGKTALVRREPVYEGFRKVGETIICTVCGESYADGRSVPWAERERKPDIFGDADKEQAPSIFRDDERGRCCRYCEYFVVNPFTQRCGLHQRIVSATDFCEDFKADSRLDSQTD